MVPSIGPTTGDMLNQQLPGTEVFPNNSVCLLETIIWSGISGRMGVAEV